MFELIMLVFAIFLFIWIIVPLVMYVFADYSKVLQKYYCKIGWHCHMKDYQFDSFDGLSEHCTCKWCGYKGMVDSQGNLF